MWTLILSFVLKLFDFVLDRVKADAESRKAFLDMISSLSKSGLVSVSLHQSYEDQRLRNQEELAKLNTQT